jgi:DNA-binding CsgD family transcriptional regulator
VEEDFSFGIVRQLFEPVRAACEPGDWDGLLDGAALLARRVFDGGPLNGGAGEKADPHATTHGLYWLAANLAARQPLVIAVDDLHWADAPSLRWLSHLAARIEDLPITLLLAARSGPDQPDLIAELRAFPYCTRVTPRPLSEDAVAVLLREYLGDAAADGGASRELSAACYESTDGNPFLLESLFESLVALRDERGPDAPVTVDDVRATGPELVAEATLRRAGQLGAGAETLTRAVGVLGGPAPLRHAAALAGQDIPRAARLADSLRAAGVLAPGAEVEFAVAIVGTAVYDSIPPSERALAHVRAAQILEGDGADPERVALHLLRSLPAGDPRAVAMLLAAAEAATGRGAPDMAAGYLRRALDEPPPAEARGEVLLRLGLALASVRNPAAVRVLRDAVAHLAAQATASAGTAAQASAGEAVDAALVSAGALGLWGHHDSAQEICRETLTALRAAGVLDQATEDCLGVGRFADSWLNAATAAAAWESWSGIRTRLRAATAEDGAPGAAGLRAVGGEGAWRVFDALSATITTEGRPAVMAHLGPVLDGDLACVESYPPALGTGLLVLTWNDEYDTALRVSDRLLAVARQRGSMNMVADVCCHRSGILRRLGRLKDAATDARYGFDIELQASPPLTLAWSATYLIEALVRLGQLDEADEVAELVAARQPPAGWLQTTTYTQARGLLRVTQRRFDEGLDDLRRAGEAWHALGVTNPSVAWWRSPAVTALLALSRDDEAAAMAAEQLELARRAGTKMVIGSALRVAAPFSSSPVDDLREAVRALEKVNARFDAAWTLAELGARLRRAGERADAQHQLRRALDLAERSGAAPLSAYARAELLAAGARPRRTALTGPDALTSAERQVAALAAEGMTNRQIAQHLFITQATVESHLRHAFHKLGIRSRSDLPAHLPK